MKLTRIINRCCLNKFKYYIHNMFTVKYVHETVNIMITNLS